ncbi:hypothetical protein L228DRAFT_280005 [Xylona heveae TC161]|uniref:Zn(2)-C6 fungal-type domain-containing protein n=1 Tax=Xylona heveae (strain CBS 132557 / TC161) TaxID=1328760 RepID=A0A165K0L7_XYLHT|nr:hypothetical protein L228DRAFT_280005 [Xylona heveae TC161]KZF26855.1 hypothetical protein L228DRAFT_280005 [Xylona heveae TC161]
MEPIANITVDVQNPISRPIKRRRRAVLSCTNCHERKQKCDREQPCFHCRSRGKQHECCYESPHTRQETRASQVGEVTPPQSSPENEASDVDEAISGLEQLHIFGYSKLSDRNSLALLNKVIDPSSTALRHSNQVPVIDNGIRDKYRSLIRSLPARRDIELLASVYFEEISWYYESVDASFFSDEIEEWYKCSFTALKHGPSKLSESMRYFPALLFQVIALALQYLPPGKETNFGHLKIGEGQSYDDLAADYSDSGVVVLDLLGKPENTVVAVQARFLRVSFLKNVGRVVESWHVMGMVVKEAYEIGLHREQPITKQSMEETAEALWETELRRRLMMHIYLWDSQMAVVLGRAVTINLRDCDFKAPTDTPIPRNRRETIPVARHPRSAPNPTTIRIHEYEMHKRLPEIMSLEAEGTYPKNYSKIYRLHQQVLDYMNTVPETHRFENPVTVWDEQYPWLPLQRELSCCSSWFFLLALYRPYIFTHAFSRIEAFKASIAILQCQERLYHIASMQFRKLFSLAFFTVDAAVICAAVIISHPYDTKDFIPLAVQCLQQSKARLEDISDRNTLAKAGSVIINALLDKANKVIEKMSLGTSIGSTSQTPALKPTSVAYNTPDWNTPDSLIPSATQQENTLAEQDGLFSHSDIFSSVDMLSEPLGDVNNDIFSPDLLANIYGLDGNFSWTTGTDVSDNFFWNTLQAS